MTCYIIDDDVHAMHAITKYVDRIPYLKVIGSNTNPLIALEEIENGKKPDIVFLDVEMPELSGIELADLLPSTIAIIITTASSHYAYDAFEKNAIDFLFKPFAFERFLKAVVKVQRYLQKDRWQCCKDMEQIYVRSRFKNKIVSIFFNKVVHVEALDHYIYINMLDEKHIIYMTMREFEERLPKASFVRIHRSHIINMDLIKSIEDNQILMSNGIKIPLSKSFREMFLDRLEPKIFKIPRIG